MTDIAEYTGLGKASVYTMNGRAAQHRRKAEETGDESHVKAGDLPEPDGKEEVWPFSPWWFQDTVKAWWANRPGAYNQKWIDRNRGARRTK